MQLCLRGPREACVAAAAATVRSSSLHGGLYEGGQPYLGTGIGQAFGKQPSQQARLTENCKYMSVWRTRIWKGL